MRQILTKYTIRNKFRIRNIQSAFRKYINLIILENKYFQGERGLEAITYQKQKLLNFLKNYKHMKLNIRTEGLFEKPEYNDKRNKLGNQEHIYTLPSTHFNISNEDELTQTLENSVK